MAQGAASDETSNKTSNTKIGYLSALLIFRGKFDQKFESARFTRSSALARPVLLRVKSLGSQNGRSGPRCCHSVHRKRAAQHPDGGSPEAARPIDGLAAKAKDRAAKERYKQAAKNTLLLAAAAARRLQITAENAADSYARSMKKAAEQKPAKKAVKKNKS